MESIRWLLPISGFVVGMLVGLTGMGGGVLMTPLLLLVFGLPPSLAVGTDLTYATFTKLVGALQHWRQKTVDLQIVVRLALGSLPAALISVRLLAIITQRYDHLVEIWLSRAIGATLILAAMLILYRLLFPEARTLESAQGYRPERSWRLIAIGALGGGLVGLTSVGSGSLILALLVFFVPLAPARLIGTDISHAVLLVATAALAHFALGNVDFGIAGLLLLGSIPGVLIGSRLTVRVPRKGLQCLLAGLLLVSAIPLLR